MNFSFIFSPAFINRIVGSSFFLPSAVKRKDEKKEFTTDFFFLSVLLSFSFFSSRGGRG